MLECHNIHWKDHAFTVVKCWLWLLTLIANCILQAWIKMSFIYSIIIFQHKFLISPRMCFNCWAQTLSKNTWNINKKKLKNVKLQTETKSASSSVFLGFLALEFKLKIVFNVLFESFAFIYFFFLDAHLFLLVFGFSAEMEFLWGFCSFAYWRVMRIMELVCGWFCW